MRDSRIYLKVKVKSLAAEARIIRHEEAKARKWKNTTLRVSLAGHRRGIVRSAARHTHLAYGFLRGRPYRTMEAKCAIKPDWKRVQTMVEKYGADYDHGNESWQDFQKRKSEQLEHFKDWCDKK